MNKLLKAKLLLLKIASRCVAYKKVNLQTYNNLCRRRERVRKILIALWN